MLATAWSHASSFSKNLTGSARHVKLINVLVALDDGLVQQRGNAVLQTTIRARGDHVTGGHEDRWFLLPARGNMHGENQSHLRRR